MANSPLSSIKRSSDFEKLKKEGKRLRLAPWLLLNLGENDLGLLRIGFTIQKKIGPSVVRNKLRRVFRERIRELLKSGKVRSLDVNFIFLPTSETNKDKNFFKKATRNDFAHIFQRLEKVLLEGS